MDRTKDREDLGEFSSQISTERAEELLREDLHAAERAVNGVRTDLHQYQFDALVSFTFNVGVGAFNGSTLKRRLDAGEKERAVAEFGRWHLSDGQRLWGLARRRATEAALFCGFECV
jgi:lysozyme